MFPILLETILLSPHYFPFLQVNIQQELIIPTIWGYFLFSILFLPVQVTSCCQFVEYFLTDGTSRKSPVLTYTAVLQRGLCGSHLWLLQSVQHSILYTPCILLQACCSLVSWPQRHGGAHAAHGWGAGERHSSVSDSDCCWWPDFMIITHKTPFPHLNLTNSF